MKFEIIGYSRDNLQCDFCLSHYPYLHVLKVSNKEFDVCCSCLDIIEKFSKAIGLLDSEVILERCNNKYLGCNNK